MLRRSVWFWCAFLVFVTCGSGLCQGIPGCLPPFIPSPQSCAASSPAPPPPITRTVQVDVPVPCSPVCCGPVMPCQPNTCAAPVCAPPCPTQPVQVRVDVRVRPEPCGQQRPDQNVCRDYGALGPIIGMSAAIMSAPIRLLERMLPGPSRRRPPQVPCGPYGAPPHWGCPPAPPAWLAPGCPMPSHGPVPVCQPPMPVPAYRKCVPRAAFRPITELACPPYPSGPSAAGGSTR
jgi:hypothetical protein